MRGEQNAPEDQLERVAEARDIIVGDVLAGACALAPVAVDEVPEPAAVLQDDRLVEAEPLGLSSNDLGVARRVRSRAVGSNVAAHEDEQQERRDQHDRDRDQQPADDEGQHHLLRCSVAGRAGPCGPARPYSFNELSLNDQLPDSPTGARFAERPRTGLSATGPTILSLHSRMFGSGSSGSDAPFSAEDLARPACSQQRGRPRRGWCRPPRAASSSPGMFVRVQFWPALSFAVRRDVLRAEQVAQARVERGQHLGVQTPPGSACGQALAEEVTGRLVVDRHLEAGLASCSWTICWVSSRRLLPAVVLSTKVAVLPSFAQMPSPFLAQPSPVISSSTLSRSSV